MAIIIKIYDFKFLDISYRIYLIFRALGVSPKTFIFLGADHVESAVPVRLKLISIRDLNFPDTTLYWPAARSELEEVEENHQTEEDGWPGDVDETSDGGDGDTAPLTLHRGESHPHGRLLYYVPQLWGFITSLISHLCNWKCFSCYLVFFAAMF